MSALSEQIVAQAQSTPGLSSDQIERIKLIAPFMSENDLAELKGMLDDLAQAAMTDMQDELEVRKQVAAKHEEYEADQARANLATQEAGERKTEAAQAESLLKNI